MINRGSLHFYLTILIILEAIFFKVVNFLLGLYFDRVSQEVIILEKQALVCMFTLTHELKAVWKVIKE